MNHIRLVLKLRTTDWPAAVARDFLLAAANTVPLYTPDGSIAPLESRTVDEDIRVLAQLANQIQLNDGKKKYISANFTNLVHRYVQCVGVYKAAPGAHPAPPRSPMMPRPPPPNSLALQQQQQQQQTKDWSVPSVPPPNEPPPPAPPVEAPPVVARPLPPVPARNSVQVSTAPPPPIPPVVPVRQVVAPASNGDAVLPPAQQQPVNGSRTAPPPIPARNLPPVPPRTAK